PAAIGDVAVTVDCAAETAPTFTTTVSVCVMSPALMRAHTVFDPAAVELSVPVICPLASVVPTGCVSVFPVVGVAARVTVAPLIRSEERRGGDAGSVELPLPAVNGAEALTVDCAADTPQPPTPQ